MARKLCTKFAIRGFLPFEGPKTTKRAQTVAPRYLRFWYLRYIPRPSMPLSTFCMNIADKGCLNDDLKGR